VEQRWRRRRYGEVSQRLECRTERYGGKIYIHQQSKYAMLSVCELQVSYQKLLLYRSSDLSQAVALRTLLGRCMQFFAKDNLQKGVAQDRPASCGPRQNLVVSWFSAGVSSAVATKTANPDKIIYIDIDDQHPDTYRFLADCEKWFDMKIEVLKSPLGSVENTCYAASFIRGPHGAPCTTRLKKRERKLWEMDNPGQHTYVWGFDSNEKERAEGTKKAMPEYNHFFPIIDRTKNEVHGILEHAGIKRPMMYDMGYPNNNCIGCVKGGMGYWNKIRDDFPEVFARRSAMERKIGAHLLKECYLDELEPGRGRNKIVVPDCGIFCEIEQARPAPKSATQNTAESAKNSIQQAECETASCP